MTPTAKGITAVTIFAAVHVALIAGATAVLYAPLKPAPAVASLAVPQPDVQRSVQQVAVPAPRPPKSKVAAAPAQAIPAQQAALSFLKQISQGDFDKSHAMLADSARRNTPRGEFRNVVEPLRRAGMKSVSWQRATIPASAAGNTALQTVELEAVITGRTEAIDIKMTLTAADGVWKVGYFRFKGRPLPQPQSIIKSISTASH